MCNHMEASSTLETLLPQITAYISSEIINKKELIQNSTDKLHNTMNHEMKHNGMSPANMMPGMDHDMPGHDMPGMKMCKMSMTLNSDYENLCILTDKLMVTSISQLIFAMVGIALFTFGYEYFKVITRKMETRYTQYLNSNTVTENERKKHNIKLSAIYAFSVGYSFLIMLLFMSFNVWIMLAVCIGAGLGHYLLDVSEAAVNLVCH